MQFVSGQSIVGQYFDKKRATANAFSLVFNNIGAVVLAPIIQVRYMMDT